MAQAQARRLGPRDSRLEQSVVVHPGNMGGAGDEALNSWLHDTAGRDSLTPGSRPVIGVTWPLYFEETKYGLWPNCGVNIFRALSRSPAFLISLNLKLIISIHLISIDRSTYWSCLIKNSSIDIVAFPSSIIVLSHRRSV